MHDRYRRVIEPLANHAFKGVGLPEFFIRDGEFYLLNRELSDAALNPCNFEFIEISIGESSARIFLLNNPNLDWIFRIYISRSPRVGEELLDWNKRHYEMRTYERDSPENIQVAEYWQCGRNFYAILRTGMKMRFLDRQLLIEDNYRRIVRSSDGVLSASFVENPITDLEAFGFKTAINDLGKIAE